MSVKGKTEKSPNSGYNVLTKPVIRPDEYRGMKKVQNLLWLGGTLDQEHHLKLTLMELLKATSECSFDMHEPDNVGVSAIVTGNHLDNAMGASGEGNEFVVTFMREGVNTFSINLADLIALARQANI